MRLSKTVGILVNRLVIGFVFAFIYQAMTGVATSVLSIPLTGTIQDLLWGLERGDHTLSTLAITWWVISTSVFTLIATQLVRFRKKISPYRGESMDLKPHVTISSLAILGATMSFLFFLLDLVLGATVSDIATIYESAAAGDYWPLAVSMLFSVVAGFVVVGVIGRSSKVVKITEKIKKKFAKDADAKTMADTSGLAPGTLIHVGKRRVDKTWFSIIRYGKDCYTEVPKTHDIDEAMNIGGKENVNWLNMTGVHDAEHVRQIGKKFKLHELHQANVMNTELRPALYTSSDNLFMTLKMPHYDNDGNIAIEHISLVLGTDHVISFQEADGDVFDKVRENIRKSRGDFRNMDGDYLVYALIDAIVDNFFVIMERIGNQTEELEKELMIDPRPETLQVIYALKRQMITLRKIIWPIREVINGLEQSHSPLIQDVTKRYFRDVYNHAVQSMDMLESLRETVGGMLDTYLSSVSNKMNEVMKTLTVIASIFIPITFIASIYGTNFTNIPELELDGGYFIMLGVMVAVTGGMLLWMRKKSWL